MSRMRSLDIPAIYRVWGDLGEMRTLSDFLESLVISRHPVGSDPRRFGGLGGLGDMGASHSAPKPTKPPVPWATIDK